MNVKLQICFSNVYIKVHTSSEFNLCIEFYTFADVQVTYNEFQEGSHISSLQYKINLFYLT